MEGAAKTMSADAARKIEPATMSVDDAAHYLGVSSSLLRRLAREGRGPAVCVIGSVVRYRPCALDEYLDACEAGSCSSVAALSGGPNFSIAAPSTVSPRVREIAEQRRKERARSALKSNHEKVHLDGDEA